VPRRRQPLFPPTEPVPSVLYVQEIGQPGQTDTPEFQRLASELARRVAGVLLENVVAISSNTRIMKPEQRPVAQADVDPSAPLIQLWVPQPAAKDIIEYRHDPCKLAFGVWSRWNLVFAGAHTELYSTVSEFTANVAFNPHDVYNAALHDAQIEAQKWQTAPRVRGIDQVAEVIANAADAGVAGAYFALGMISGDRPRVILPQPG
jgi:hypothetical protein